MFALVDVNNFYASCERLFEPRLEGVAVVVLSNNDGCIIARSQEAKDLGIPMGEPVHKVKDVLRRERVRVYSSNYALYGDLSGRVVSVLKRFTPYLEVYSIDESFLDLGGFTDPAAHSHDIKDTVLRWTGLPVSVGVGATKTLAKAANRWRRGWTGSASPPRWTSRTPTPNSSAHVSASPSKEPFWSFAARRAWPWK